MAITVNDFNARSRDKIDRLQAKIDVLRQVVEGAGLLVALQAQLSAAGLPSNFSGVIEQITAADFTLEAIIVQTEAFMFDNGLFGGAVLGVQDITELTALDSFNREDKQIRLVEDLGVTYRFDAESVTDPVPDEDVEIPDDITHPDPGRWIKIEPTEADEIGLLVASPARTITGETTVQGALDKLAQSNAPGVQTIVALTAIVAVDRSDKMIRLVEDTGLTYRFDAESTIDPVTDPDFEIPDDITHPDPGRWILVEPNEADEVAYDNATSGLTATNVQAAIDELGAAKVEFDFFLDLGTGTTEAAQIAAIDAAAAAVAGVIAAKGQAVIAIKGEITWITAATVPASHSNIVWFKTGLTVVFPVGMETGAAATAYFRGTNTSVTGAVGRILIEEDTATLTERTIWDGAGNGVCENWFVEVVGATSNAYPFAVFIASGKGSSISGITANPDATLNQRTYKIKLDGEKAAARNCDLGFMLEGTGLDLVMLNCKSYRTVLVDVGANFARLDGVSTVFGSTSTFTVLADDVRVANTMFGWTNSIAGNRCLMTNISNTTTNSLTVSGADCKLVNLNVSNATVGLAVLGNGFNSSNTKNSVLTITADRVVMRAASFHGSISTTGEDLDLELEFVGQTTFGFDFSGLTGASKLVVFWAGQANGSSISPINEWFKGFGVGTEVTLHMRLDGVPGTTLMKLNLAGVFADYADAQTIDFIDDIQVITVELDDDASVTPGNVPADISGAGTLADIGDAIKLALNNSDSALQLAADFTLTSKRFLAMEYPDVNGSDGVTSIVNTTNIPMTILRGITGLSRLPALQNSTDCDVKIYTNSGSGTLGNNVVAAILPSFSGSVEVHVSEALAADNPIIVCLATGVNYKIVNRIGETQLGWDWGATGTIDFSGGGGTDAVASIVVGGVTITSGPEVWDSDLATTVQNVVDNINAFTSATDYTAEVFPGDPSRIIIREVVAVGGALTIEGNITDNGGGLAVNAALTFKLGGAADFGVTKSMLRVTGKTLHYANSVNKSADNLVDGLLTAVADPVTGNIVGNDHRGTT